MAKVLKVSQSGYYKWVSKSEKKGDKDEALRRQIIDIFIESRGSYGSKKITRKVNEKAEKAVNHKRVERVMRENGLFSKTKKKYIQTTDSRHSEEIAENLLKRDFTAKAPNEKMVSDTTVVQTEEGNLFVAGIVDLYGRVPVGIAMSKRKDRELVKEALEDMLIRGKGRKGCIIHSDRGSIYASKEYREMLEKNGLICSMSRKGDCWDNAPIESFCGKLKSEWLKKKYDTIGEAARDIYEYVWSFYPNERPHESLGYLTPSEFYRQSKSV